MVLNNVLTKFNTDKPTGFVNFSLMHHLTPNEFYTYTYLLNAPDDFSPTYDKLKILLNIKSNTTIYKIINSLKFHKLLDIERIDSNVFIWRIYNIDEKETKQVLINELERHQTINDRIEWQKEIDKLEKKLDEVDGDEFGEIMKQIIDLQMKMEGS